jgi:hypothetical protein
MERRDVIEPLTYSFDVACSVHHAFETWTSKIDSWWPAGHTYSGEADASVVLEPRVGGRIYERTSDGAEHEWGEVTVWDPPVKFGYLWRLRKRREDGTDVEIRFTEVNDDATRVEIVHTGWERLGAGGSDWRERNTSGWSGVLPHYIAAAEAP